MIPGDRSHEPSTTRCFKHGPAPVIGLTGGLASGKSSVANLLGVRGFTVIDADSIGHDVLNRPDVQRALVARFGPGILDSKSVSAALEPQIDRKALGAIVFADQEARRSLEAIVHPFMRAKFTELFERALGPGRPAPAPVLLDAAILFEAGWNDLCDLVVFVDAPRSERLGRAASDRGWSEADFAARERAQWPCEQKRRRADLVIRNDAGLDSLRSEVESLLARFAGQAAASASEVTPDLPQPSGRPCKVRTGSEAWQNPCAIS
jgi:dephospho-CoA kinase